MKKLLNKHLSPSDYKQFFTVLAIFVLALSLRLYGINWDQGTHLHPDERFLTMVANDIHLPSSIGQYFNPSTSPLNPYNYQQFQFYVYGIFPVFITKFLSVLLGLDSYKYLHLVGRVLSSFFDSFNIILLYLIARKTLLLKNKLTTLPSFLYATSVLPVQLSHFFTVDTFLNTFLLASFTLLVYSRFFLAAVFFGLAMSCKISASLFVPIFVVFIVKNFIKNHSFSRTAITAITSGLLAFIVFRIFDPYIFDGLIIPSKHYLDNLKTLQSFSDPDGWFPPAVQWMSKVPLVFSLQNIVLWGLGIPATVLLIITFFKRKFATTQFYYWLVVANILITYLFQGSQFAHNMRYFLPLYPFVFLLITYKLPHPKPFVAKLLIVGHLLFVFSFLGIYSRPNSRIQASDWIYKHIPAGSILSYEEWDDALPLNYDNHSSQIYQIKGLPLYDPDGPRKWEKINPILSSVNYMVLSSNRLWGSIPLVPQRYPETTLLYQSLFSGQHQFKQVYQSSSYPGFSIPFIKSCYYLGPSNIPGIKNTWFDIDNECQYPGVYFRDDIAEESFSVYDHPRVFIFKH
jgi:hypothetical protein